jgi:hypothetical protein
MELTAFGRGDFCRRIASAEAATRQQAIGLDQRSFSSLNPESSHAVFVDFVWTASWR